MSWGQRQKHVCRLVACTALLAVVVTPGVAAGAERPAATAMAAVGAAAAGTGSATVTLSSVMPAVSVPRTPVIISGQVRNAGQDTITEPIVRVLIGDRGLTSRAAVSDWATSAGQRFVALAASAELGASLAPGAVATFSLVVPANAISHRQSFAVLPVTVEVVGTTSSDTEHLGSRQTFLPSLSSIKAYEPISVAWLVPLTLDPDPALHGMDTAARAAAWTKAIGPGSRLDRLITGTDSTKVTWAIDPAILGPPPAAASVVAPTPGTGSSPSSTPTPGGTSTPDPVTAATSALASRLKEAAPRHTLWSLPYADPDLAALLPLASGDAATRALIARQSAVDAAVAPTRTGIAWPVDGTLTNDREKKLRAAYSSQGLRAAVTSASTASTRSGYTDNAGRKSRGGLPLLSYDQALSRTFTQTAVASAGAVSIQRFLADSMALLGERPGTRGRSVLVTAPRTFAGDPAVLSTFFAAIGTAPWLVPATADQLLAASDAATPEGSGTGTNPDSPSTTPTSPPTAAPTASRSAPDPLSPGTSPLSSSQLRTISRTTSAITGIASIRDDAQLFRVRWTDAQDQLLSTRWRGHPRGIAAVNAATGAAITAVSRGVRVAPSSVNFFADRGVLQITVVNDLSVPVHDVRLTLTPGQPRLRIEQQPGPLKIGPKSRTNVPIHVTAIAAGLVPIEAVLTTANGTPLGQNARVDVRVQPPSTWIYWALGVLAGIILVLGIYRSLRRGSTRGSRPAAQGITPR